MMRIRSLRRLLAKLHKDERGLTLVDLIASSLIFFTILIPIVSVYVKGVEIYQDTTIKTQLRNETDFIIGSVMQTVQEASYVKLAPEPSDSQAGPTDEQVKNIIAASFPAMNRENAASSSQLYIYKRSVKRSSGAGADENSTTTDYRTVSLITRETYSFEPCPPSESGVRNCSHIPFSTDQNSYLVQGYFEMAPESSNDSAKKQVTLYLVVALRYDTLTLPSSEEDKQNHELFADWNEVESAIAQNSEKAQYIRVVRTEIDLSSEQKG